MTVYVTATFLNNKKEYYAKFFQKRESFSCVGRKMCVDGF